MQLITVSHKQNGDQQIEFSLTETFRILRDELGFRHSIFKNKKIFFRLVNDQKVKVEFQDLKEAFRKYLKDNYTSLNIPDSVTIEDLIDATYKKTSIFISNSLLRKELTEDIAFTHK